ncbi:membrane protein [Novosphingobium sediminis]|uniref:Membrane protein n=1 Tax=Novosphingobium sediminis TaxID=707214 RepID=A0A512AN65_9SPHN|nr:YoaK family protein [Novosphingobium sediminis]GEO01150.1 membrane protein [Novosphingobium sediminis]
MMDAAPALKTPRPLFRLLLLLSGTTGMLDAASILCLGKVFTANMTGNVVFLGFAAAGAKGFAPGPFLIALIAFVIGAMLAGRLWRRPGPQLLRNWLILVAAIETVLLLLAGLAAYGTTAIEAGLCWRLPAILALTAGAMGFRNAIVRQLKVPDLTTTVLTLTITGIAADSHLAAGSAPNFAVRISAVAMIFGGALAGALLVIHTGLSATLLITGGVVFLGTALFAAHPQMADIKR